MKTNTLILIYLLLSLTIFSQTNRGIILSSGMLINKTLCNNLLVDKTYNISNPCTGGITYSFELGAKLKFSKHFSVEFGYQRLSQHIESNFNDLEIQYVDNFTHTGNHYAGIVSYTDNIYLFGNHYYLGMNYELTKGKNNLTIGFCTSRINYNTNKTYITRSYSALQTNSYLPDINSHYSSKLHTSALLSFNLNIRFERIIYKNKLGIYCKLLYQVNPDIKYFEYAHDDMGINSNYEYSITDKEGQRYYNHNYFSFKFNSMLFSAGLFYKLNFKEHEKKQS